MIPDFCGLTPEFLCQVLKDRNSFTCVIPKSDTITKFFFAQSYLRVHSHLSSYAKDPAKGALDALDPLLLQWDS